MLFLHAGVNPAGDTSPNILVGGDVNGNIPTQYYYVVSDIGKGKVFPYSLPSVGPGADPGVQAVSPQVT